MQEFVFGIKRALVSPVRSRNVVVFPAPFGPRKPKISPFLASKVMPSTARISSYHFVRSVTSMAFSEGIIDFTF